MSGKQRAAEASLDAILRIFTVPEAPDSKLSQVEHEISENLAGFLKENIVAVEKPLHEIEKDFRDPVIPEEPTFVSTYTQNLLEKAVSQSVHTASPSFIGHMTSALPYFLLPLSKLMVGLNQNLVKIETSKAFTPLERQVLGMMHRLVYGFDEKFYTQTMHSSTLSLGSFCSGGTVANMTALWIAKNRLLKPDGNFRGIAKEGLFRAMQYYGYQGLAILVSERGHYSLGKTADLLGIGRDMLISVETDANNKVNTSAMRQKAKELASQNIQVMTIVGVAGTTETGNVDPLDELADLAEELDCYFHVDAAWGGATLLSNNYRHLFKGIERADSVTIDAHKQMYIPMGAGMVVFKNSSNADAIEHHAEYILRRGSKDLGSHTLEGSRPGMAMMVHSSLQIIGRRGYELLIDGSIEKARMFAEMIKSDPNYELITAPELCLLTYRYLPDGVQAYLSECTDDEASEMNDLLNGLTKFIQKRQREAGFSFVSRTQLPVAAYSRKNLVVFRVVLANPLTTKENLRNILDEQKELAQQSTRIYPKIRQLLVSKLEEV
ncbi:pyridoxal-dependent aspartate 1-decarboxylase PanP [Algicola sagamiensis]|uniref:pyridoxal-dependent aspartate 1-decarboxylase PanP n=1 Tax=Algicola sagamiensis TaxID=163869 RepID=UPI0003712B95|nr:putative pyridoxal-dependent aspartate 1-decarboxylase [Algicola sagamiensis]